MKQGLIRVTLTVIFLLFSLPITGAWDWNNPGKAWADDPAFRTEVDWTAPDYRALAAALFFHLNDLRALNGKTPLAYRPALESAAQVWSKNLLDKNLLIQDPSLKDRMTQVGAGVGVFAELISQTASPQGLTVLQLAKELADIWYASPSHRSVLLRDDILEGACGISGKEVGGYFDVRTVFSFRLAPRATPAVQEKPLSPSNPQDSQAVLKTEPPTLNWGVPLTTLRNPRFFGSWTGGREAYRIDFTLESLLGSERPQWILGITRPRNQEFSALFIKVTGQKAPGLLTRFRNAFGEPSATVNATVDADTEPARIYIWQGSSSELRLYEGETHTYVRLSER